jgi:hypothetical protein
MSASPAARRRGAGSPCPTPRPAAASARRISARRRGAGAAARAQAAGRARGRAGALLRLRAGARVAIARWCAGVTGRGTRNGVDGVVASSALRERVLKHLRNGSGGGHGGAGLRSPRFWPAPSGSRAGPTAPRPVPPAPTRPWSRKPPTAPTTPANAPQNRPEPPPSHREGPPKRRSPRAGRARGEPWVSGDDRGCSWRVGGPVRARQAQRRSARARRAPRAAPMRRALSHARPRSPPPPRSPAPAAGAQCPIPYPDRFHVARFYVAGLPGALPGGSGGGRGLMRAAPHTLARRRRRPRRARRRRNSRSCSGQAAAAGRCAARAAVPRRCAPLPPPHPFPPPDKTLKDEPRLLLYALEQQAVAGPCNTPQPWAWNLVESAKWQGWKQLVRRGAPGAGGLAAACLGVVGAECGCRPRARRRPT